MTATLDELFEAAGCVRIETPILHPAEPFLNAAGEAFRKSLFVTSRADGEALCLRPDFTIPVCLAHKGGPARYHYSGTVFRQSLRPGDSSHQEREQVGVEAFGEADWVKADTDMVRLALAAVRALSDVEPVVLIGDPAFFDALVQPVGLPKIWRERLTRAFGNADLINTMLQRMVTPPNPGETAFADADAEKLAHEVAAMMASHAISPTAGRTPEEIVRRFIKKRDDQITVSNQVAEICQLFLALECAGSRAGATMARFGTQHGIDFSPAIERYDARLAGLQDEEAELVFAASFGRSLEYYTGFVFEIHDARNRAAGPVAGGGRYDGLSELLGGASLPAVGFSIWLDRMTRKARG